ncbi:MAG: hypothetical protein M5R40_16180 [Anaerolineae bacterium]|nr:hypothetical protein [Anaerolineae bacterium]
MTHKAFEQGEGILRLAPNWVPRDFCIPGRRIKLHPDDYYAYGTHRGGIDERWFASTVKADNGPLTTPDEGLSFVVYGDAGREARVRLADLVDEMGAQLLGDPLWDRFHRWPMYSKFFDNQGPLPHHIHHREEHAALVGQLPKPEAYYFPPQLNNHPGDFPHLFLGLEADTTKDQVHRCLAMWEKADNHILNLSKAFSLESGTGWYVPAGMLHAPGSLCTYEPQWASDVFAMFQNIVSNVYMDRSLLVKNVPEDRRDDLDYLISLVDWEANTRPDLKNVHARRPVSVRPVAEMEAEGYIEKWIVYGNEYIAAKELTVLPGRRVTLRDAGPYGTIAVQGHGAIGVWPVETPTLIRFGQLTYDEFFVSYPVAQAGVTIRNDSAVEPLVMLKHFGPNPETPGLS